MKIQSIRWLALVSLLNGGLSASAQYVSGTHAQSNAPFVSETSASSGHEEGLEFGARIHYFSLKDTRRTTRNGQHDNSNIRGNFIGSVWGLDEIQNYIPRLYLQYAVSPFWGAGITYDSIGAKTKDWRDPINQITSSDGDVTAWGPMLYLFARYPNETRITPLIELGWVHYFADFDEDALWAASGPGFRFEVDNTDGYYLALGLDFDVADNWHVNTYWRRTFDTRVDTRAYFSPGPQVGRYGVFPLEYEMFGLGTSYRF